MVRQKKKLGVWHDLGNDIDKSFIRSYLLQSVRFALTSIFYEIFANIANSLDSSFALLFLKHLTSSALVWKADD